MITHAAEQIAMGMDGRKTDAIAAYVDKARINEGNDKRFNRELMDADQRLTKARKNLDSLGNMFVSQTLLLPMLKQIRNDPLRSDLFHGGFAEDAFRQKFDERIADRIAQSGALPIGKVIADKFMPHVEHSDKQLEALANLNLDVQG